MKFLLVNILFAVIIQLTSSIGLNQSLLIQKYGFEINSVEIDLSERSIDYIDINTFKGYNKLEKLHLEENKIKQLEYGLLNHLESLKDDGKNINKWTMQELIKVYLIFQDSRHFQKKSKLNIRRKSRSPKFLNGF